MPALWFFGPINTEGMRQSLGIPLQVGAAARKVEGILRAVQAHGWQGHLVATPIVGSATGRWWHAGAVHQEPWGVVHQGPALGKPALNRLLAGWTYARWAFRVPRHEAKVVFYNFFPEFIPAAWILRCRGIAAHLDVEDYPDGLQGMRSRINRWSFAIMRRLCHPHPLVASTGIAQRCQASVSCVIHGVLTDNDQGAEPVTSTTPLRVLYGGTIRPDTGSDLAVAALRILRSRGESIPPITCIVTGFGDVAALRSLADTAHPTVRVEVHADLDAPAYRNMLRSCHAGLCLKLPDSDVGQTTFPSKSVEIAANGLVLVSTDVSDVGRLFQDAALLLDRAEGTDLADALVRLAKDPHLVERLSRAGLQRVQEQQSPAAVGQRLLAFFETP